MGKGRGTRQLSIKHRVETKSRFLLRYQPLKITCPMSIAAKRCQHVAMGVFAHGFVNPKTHAAAKRRQQVSYGARLQTKSGLQSGFRIDLETECTRSGLREIHREWMGTIVCAEHDVRCQLCEQPHIAFSDAAAAFAAWIFRQSFSVGESTHGYMLEQLSLLPERFHKVA